MKAAAKALLLAIGAYVGTVAFGGVAAGVALAFMSPRGCASYGRALVVVWVVVAIAFLLGLLTTGLASLWMKLSAAARLGLVGALGAALLATYVVVALGLTVAFNC